MTFPILTDYKIAVTNAKARFATLDVIPHMDERRNPKFLAGNFAGVFKMTAADGSVLAVKCFTRDMSELERRYRAVAKFVKSARSSYFVRLDYLPSELYVTSPIAGAGEYAVVAMPWVEGRSMGAVIQALCAKGNSRALAGLTRAWARLCLDLLGRGIAHGDLKHDNVLVSPEGTLLLIDYDSMYLPELRGLRCPLLGGVNFQHPARSEAHFDPLLDHFSMLVILLSLRALVLEPGLFQSHHNGENIILTGEDFADPAKSALLSHMSKSKDYFIADWADKLVKSCGIRSLQVRGLSAMLKAATKLDISAESPGVKWLFYRLSANAA